MQEAVFGMWLGVWVGRRRWCWKPAGVVSCGTTSVVQAASPSVVVRRRWYRWLARQLWYDVGGAGG